MAGSEPVPGQLSPEGQVPRFGGRFDDGPGLRSRTARGTLVNSVFLVGLTAITFVRGFAIAALLSPSEYGIWGVLSISLGTLTLLKEIGVGDKFIQQDEEDQELAFQRAFTLDTMLNVVLVVVLGAATPVIALAYGRPELLLPGFALLLALVPASLQAPLWVFERQMKFGSSRTLAAVNPLVSTVVMVALAVGGLGYWSLVIGTVAGFWAMGAVAAVVSPHRLAFRYDRGTLRRYWSFSWPLFVDRGTSVIVAQTTIFVAGVTIGVAAAGAITLVASIAFFADRVDGVVTGALYPAICAVKDRTDLLLESFLKSNRLAIMWGIPFGLGLTLFAGDLVDYVLGQRWEFAVGLLQAFGAFAGLKQIGFNWDAFYRARSDTRPIAVLNVILVVVFLVTAIPGLAFGGLRGYAIGMAITSVVYLGLRLHFLARLFPALGVMRHLARAVAPSVPAALAVVAMRFAETGPRTPALATAELALYLLTTAVATYALERPLLNEVVGYLRGVERGRQPA